jgi:Skp family chaperone for outer membrane proteins
VVISGTIGIDKSSIRREGVRKPTKRGVANIWNALISGPHLLIDKAKSFSGRTLRFIRGSTMILEKRGGQNFLKCEKGGRIMKHAALLLGIVALFIFAACGNGDKGEQPAKSEYQGAVEEVQQEPEAVTQTPQELEEQGEGAVEDLEEEGEGAVEDLEEEGEKAEETLREKTGEAVETVREKTGEAVETVREKTGEAVEAVKEKAAQPFEGMAEKMGGHADAAKEAMEE